MKLRIERWSDFSILNFIGHWASSLVIGHWTSVISDLGSRLALRGIFEHLGREVLRVRDLDIRDFAVRTRNRRELWHDKAGVGRQIQLIDPRDNLVPQLRIEMHAISLEQLLRGRVISFALDPLNLGEQPADALTKRFRIDHHVESLAVAGALLDHLRIGYQPVHDHLPVPHVIFFELRSLPYAAELQESVACV